MEHCINYWTNIEQRNGVDIGRIGSTLQPKNREHCVGTGFDPNLQLDDLIKIAYEEDFGNIRPNIIVKGGTKRAQWYLKYFAEETIDREIDKTMKSRKCPHHKMFIITWKD